tara:strand:- start:339 stop:506 length:168 start_codon:yes stop_codon:yes gene_type:complete
LKIKINDSNKYGDHSKIQDAKKRKDCEDSKKKDLISINAGSGQVSTYRNSWRHNF